MRFRFFKTRPEIIRLAMMKYVRFPLSLRNVEDLRHERGIDISHETVRFWWIRFAPMMAAEIMKKADAALVIFLQVNSPTDLAKQRLVRIRLTAPSTSKLIALD